METTQTNAPVTPPAEPTPAMRKTRKIRVFLTHSKPHLDEIFVWWALRYFCSEKCRKDISFQCFSGSPAELSELQRDDGVLLVGIGGGKLDEHPPVNGSGKDGECAASLAIKEMDLVGIQGLERMVRFIVNQDVNAQGMPFDLAAGVRAIHLTNQDHMVAVEWACVALDAFYAKEREFANALLEFHSKARVFEIPAGNRKIKAATIVTDNTAAQQCSRFIGIQLLVQRQESGNTQIYTDKKADIPPLDDVVRILRTWEMRVKGLSIVTQWKELEQEGKVAGVEEWYYFRQGQMILNGSLTTANTPTKLSLENVREALEIGLNPDKFEGSRARDCRQGCCTSSMKSQCSLYQLGLKRCRTIRYKQHEAAANNR